jgi:hypothetical protein
VPLFEQVLTFRESRLPPDHPDTIRTMTALLKGYLAAGRLDLALPLLDSLLPRLAAKLGPNHQDLRTNEEYRKSVAKALEAEKRYETLRKTKGLANLDTLLALRDAAQYRLQFNNIDGAESALAEVLGGMASLASDDPIRAFTVGLVRKCVSAREKQQPQGWKTFSCKSLLGGALVGQKEYADAEPLLLVGYAGLEKNRDTIPAAVRSARLTEALERLVALYEATNRKGEAARWRQERDAAKANQGGAKN